MHSSIPVLDKVAETLKEYDKSVVEVAGHTDSVGSDAYNQTLSERRANSVADYLSGHGMTRTRMVTIGAGEGHPVASNDTEEGRAREPPRRDHDRAGQRRERAEGQDGLSAPSGSVVRRQAAG